MPSIRIAPAALCLALAACHDAPDPLAGAPRDATREPPPVAAGALRIALQLVDSAAGEARVALRLEHPGVRVGAYSGTVRFDPAAIDVVDAAAEGGAVVNARTGEPGAVRFAGFDVAEIRADVVAVVRVRVRDWGALARATSELTAAATDAGVPVGAARLLAARGVTTSRGGAR